jgi:hypothetical protein
MSGEAIGQTALFKKEGVMKKLFLVLTLLFLASPVGAQTTTKSFIVSAVVPATSSIGITVNRVNSQTNQWSAVNSTNLSFGNLGLNSVLGTYFANDYFSIDVAPTGAAPDYQTTVTYTEGSNPNQPRNGLGAKATLTFLKATGQGQDTVETPLSSHGPKRLLRSLNGETILSRETSPGWLRCYLGLVTMDPNALIPDPVGAEPFNVGDRPGEFSGTLTITSTIL